MNTPEHGQQRAGKIGASMAGIIDHGGKRAWDTLAKNLWADETGEAFAKATTGPRQYGHEHEAEGAAKFWHLHPETEIVGDVGWLPYIGEEKGLVGYIGASPDRMIARDGIIVAGLEVKSPVTAEGMAQHTAKQHEAQCRHAMLVTGLPVWWLVAHHGELYEETMFTRNRDWEAAYIVKLHAFLRQLNLGHVVRRRMRPSDML